MPGDFRQPPLAVDAVCADMLQEGHDVLEGVSVGQLLRGERPYDGVEHLKSEVVDEQPCLKRILVASFGDTFRGGKRRYPCERVILDSYRYFKQLDRYVPAENTL